MSCIVLQDADGKHLGFMLGQPDFNQENGECVFVVAPTQDESLDTPAHELLCARREGGESNWEAARQEPLELIVRTPGLPAEMFIELDESGLGQWGVADGKDRRHGGRAVLLANA